MQLARSWLIPRWRILATMTLVAVVVWLAATGASSSPPAEPTGPWVVSAAGGGGYLLNTETGELWRLRDEVRVPVRDLNQ